jgi:hypothetical protein
MMRRVSMLLAAALTVAAALGAGSAEAKRASDNSWTQIENGNWPDDSNTSDCGPCVKWPNSFYSGEWQYNLAGHAPGYVELISRWAWKSWSGQPFPSPMFEQGTYGCNAQDACVSAKTLKVAYCGTAQEHHTVTNIIDYGWVFLAGGKSYSNGPTAGTTADCNGRSTLLHEVGHVFSEGHSSKTAAIMYKSQQVSDKIDSWAQQELDAVYSSDGCRPCPSLDIQALKAKVTAEAQALYAQLQSTAGQTGTVDAVE